MGLRPLALKSSDLNLWEATVSSSSPSLPKALPDWKASPEEDFWKQTSLRPEELAWRGVVTATGVCEQTTPFARAFALQSSSRDCSPAPDLVLSELIVQPVFLSGGVFFHRHRYKCSKGGPLDVVMPPSNVREKTRLCFQHLCLPFRPLPYVTWPTSW